MQRSRRFWERVAKRERPPADMHIGKNLIGMLIIVTTVNKQTTELNIPFLSVAITLITKRFILCTCVEKIV